MVATRPSNTSPKYESKVFPKKDKIKPKKFPSRVQCGRTSRFTWVQHKLRVGARMNVGRRTVPWESSGRTPFRRGSLCVGS